MVCVLFACSYVRGLVEGAKGKTLFSPTYPCRGCHVHLTVLFSSVACHQLLDMIPRLNGGDERADGDGLQGLAIDLVRHLGAHSISVAQLKTVFRLLQPITVPFEDDNATTPRGASRRRRPLAIPKVSSGACGYSIAAPLNPPWMCSLLRALKGMMDDQPGPQRFFLLDGVSSGLRLPRMPRWPAQKGYTFCTWVRLEVPSNSINSVVGGGGGVAQARTPPAAAGAPCLFSFGGERGHGVAACFIPLRGRMMHENSPSAASPQQHYALELRVGTGRKKAPACIRYPSAFVTAGVWTFVAVSHSPSSWSQRGESAILLDRCWRTTASPFPRFGEGGVVAASVGCHYGTSRAPQSGDRERTPDEFGAGAKIAGRPALCSLPGQVWTRLDSTHVSCLLGRSRCSRGVKRSAMRTIESLNVRGCAQKHIDALIRHRRFDRTT